MNEIIEIRIDQLKPGDNPREIVKNDEDMKVLLTTMEANGPKGIDPIVVYETENDGSYEIDDGHRRLHCATQMEWKILRAYIEDRPRTEAQRFFKRVRRNLNQKKLTGWEKYQAVLRGTEEFKLSQKEVSEQTGMDKGTVSMIVCMQTFPELVHYLKKGGHLRKAYYLSKMTNPDMRVGILIKIDTYTVEMLRNITKSGQTFVPQEPPVESIVEPLESESRIADEVVKVEGPHVDDEDQHAGVEGHTPEDFEHPIPRPPGDDGGTVPQPTPEISPDGEPEIPSEAVESTSTSSTSPETESSPPKPTFEKRTTCLNCFKPLKFRAKAIDKKSHDCKNLFQQIEIMNLQFPNMAVKEGKNGYRLRQNGMGIDELQKGLKVIENHQNWVDNVQNATKNEIKSENAKKIGGS